MAKRTAPEVKPPKPLPQLMAELYIILIGLAFGFGVQKLVDTFSVELLLRFLALCVLLLIWLHSQLTIAQHESYKSGKNWFLTLIEHYLDTSSAILLVSASLLLDKPLVFYIIITASYIVDAVVEVIFLRRIEQSEANYERDRELSMAWIKINLVTAAISAAIIVIGVKINALAGPWISGFIFLLIFSGNVVDYSISRDFYFGIKKPGAQNTNRS